MLIETGIDVNESLVINKLDDMGITGDYSVETVGPILSDVFWNQAQLALLFAFVIMVIVVFIIFRSLIPSLAVIFAAITDIVVAMFGMSIFGITLSLPTLAGLLMLIGYSVDTDILLTTEVLKSKDVSIESSINSAIKTGLTMTLTSLSVFVVMYVVSTSIVLKEIALVVLIGLLIDMPVTWFTNAGLLRIRRKRKERVRSSV